MAKNHKIYFAFFGIVLFLFTDNGFSQDTRGKEVDSLLDLLQKTVDVKSKILVNNSIAEVLAPSLPDSAVKYCNQALKLSMTTRNDSLTGICYKCLMNAYYEKPYFEDSALFYYKRFTEVTADLPYYHLKQAGLIIAGNTYQVLHNYPEAISCFQNALENAMLTRKDEVILASKYSLSEVYRKAGHPESSRRYAEEILADGKRLKNNHWIYTGYRGIGITYDLAKEYSNAKKYFILSIQVAIESGQMAKAGNSYINLGVVQMHNLEYDSALGSLFHAMEILKPLNNEKIIPVFQNLCSVYNDMGNSDSALFYCQKGIEEASRWNQQFSLSILRGIASGIYLKKGNYKEAYELTLKVQHFNDSSSSVERSNATAQLEAKYRNKEISAHLNILKKEKDLQDYQLREQQAILYTSNLESLNKQKEIDLLNKSKENQQIQLKLTNNQLQQAKLETVVKENERSKEKFIRNSILSGMIIILVILFLLFNRFQLRKKIESQQAIIDERVRISRELHDDVGAQLSTAKMFLSDLKKNFGNEKGKEILDNSLGLLDTSIKDLRIVMDDLRQSTLKDQGYITATEELVKMIDRKHDIRFQLSHHGINSRLPQQTEHHLFRITQELINNTLKYAEARKVTIDVVRQKDKLVFTYEDDGIGFELNKVRKGYGLLNMESRVQSVDGHLEISTLPGKGFMAIIEIPV